MILNEVFYEVTTETLFGLTMPLKDSASPNNKDGGQNFSRSL